jgi:geranylgeranyl pyrophosphate synthase
MVTQSVNKALLAVDEKLRSVVASDVDLLTDASRHIIKSGGKRMRPRLVFLAYLAAGGQDVEEAVPLAAAIELVHTATLVHDDINDHSATRRGQATVHSIWGRTFALLTGDYLFTKVYEMMAPYGRDYNITMADACVKLVEGETLQAAAAKAGQMDRETYKTIIARKTASLFEAAARMGARLGGADEDMINALSSYAHDLGLAFQIVDDILDIVGDPEKTGKPVGGDLVKGAGAFVAQNGVHMDGAALLEMEAPAVENDPIAEMLARLRDSGAVEIARMEAVQIAERALRSLAELPPSPARDEMQALAETVVEREQ